MKNRIKYARLRFCHWITVFSTLLGIIACISFCFCTALILVIGCFLLAFIIPFIGAGVKKSFKIYTSGKTHVSLSFGDLFEEECFVVTTNLYFDIIPDEGKYISDGSVIGQYINSLDEEFRIQLQKDLKDELTNTVGDHAEYGHVMKRHIDGKIVYFLAFTDRLKTDQPSDFYVTTILKFFNFLVNENHGKTISVPLIGDMNELSDSGFTDSVETLNSLIAMINCFEIINQRSKLKLKIVVKEDKRADIIDTIARYI